MLCCPQTASTTLLLFLFFRSSNKYELNSPSWKKTEVPHIYGILMLNKMNSCWLYRRIPWPWRSIHPPKFFRIPFVQEYFYGLGRGTWWGYPDKHLSFTWWLKMVCLVASISVARWGIIQLTQVKVNSAAAFLPLLMRLDAVACAWKFKRSVWWRAPSLASASALKVAVSDSTKSSLQAPASIQSYSRIPNSRSSPCDSPKHPDTFVASYMQKHLSWRITLAKTF